MSRIRFDDHKPFVVEETARGWYAGEGGLGARAATREDAIAELRAVQALVKRLARGPTAAFSDVWSAESASTDAGARPDLSSD